MSRLVPKPSKALVQSSPAVIRFLASELLGLPLNGSKDKSYNQKRITQPKPLTVAGLKNLGNSCFLNSVLQSLANLRPFVDSLQKSVDSSAKRRNGQEQQPALVISTMVLYLLRELQPAEGDGRHHPDAVDPYDLHTKIHARTSQLQIHEQQVRIQDAEELLQILMNLITDEIKAKAPSNQSINPTKPSTRGVGPFMEELHEHQQPQSSTPSSASTAEAFHNPLSGWLASTLQCCRCKHRRPIQNSAFIDVALPLPESRRLRARLSSSSSSGGGFGGRSQMLNGGSAIGHHQHHHVRVSSSGGTGGSLGAAAAGGACHLMECLREFAVEETVQEVECQNCTKLERLAILEDEIQSKRRMIENVKMTEEATPTTTALLSTYREDLEVLENDYQRIKSQDPDEIVEKAFWMHSGSIRRGGLESEGVKKGDAKKRLMFSRLPKVLCLHLGRRVYNPGLGRTTKIRQKVDFPLLMDMSSYTAYGGRMIDDVAEEDFNYLPSPPTFEAFGGMRLSETAADLLGGISPSSPPNATSPTGSTSSSASSIQTTTSPATTNNSTKRTSSSAARFKYLLQSVIVHHGSADGGHYTVYRRLSSIKRADVTKLMERGGQGLLAEEINSWVHVSDDAVLPVKLEKVLECEAYMLFYQSLESL